MARFRDDLADLLPKAAALKRRLSDRGYMLTGEEPLKVTVCPKFFGYTGTEIAATLEENGAFPEFYDPDHVVLMLSPWNSDDDLVRLERTLCSIPQRTPIILTPPPVPHPVRVMTPRQALFAVSERLPLEDCCGRISAAAAISCPPAIPLVVCGERIDQQVIACLRYYGVSACMVIQE